MIFAGQDPLSAILDRVQVIKGWVDDQGNTHEKIYDAFWSAGRQLINGKPEPNADQVNRQTGNTLAEHGAATLSGVWTDPEFNPEHSAFYYARVLQVPTARHSLLDRIALGEENAEDYPDVIQERAYTSPIWYSP